MKTTYRKFRVVFTIEARDEREAIQLVSQPDLLMSEGVMRIENVNQLRDLKMAVILSPLLVAVGFICYCWWGW